VAIRYHNTSAFTLNLPLVRAFVASKCQSRRSLDFFFQTEHNLVLPGGRDLTPADQIGVVPSIFGDDELYRVRIFRRRMYYSSDVIVEYNRPNIKNIELSGALPPEIRKKIVYAPSIPFAYDNGTSRALPLITNVISESEPRRAAMLDRLRDTFAEFRNVQGIYDPRGLRDLYSSTKVLVNFHQTLHHHSIEEFRVLPALSRGCLVISEDVPLCEEIPYHEYVLWCRYDEIPAYADEVLRNYDRYFAMIHGEGSTLRAALDEMKREFGRSLAAVLADDELFGAAAVAKRRVLRGIDTFRSTKSFALIPAVRRRARKAMTWRASPT
jgi:hypothetical protein